MGRIKCFTSYAVAWLGLLTLCGGCFTTSPSSGGGQAKFSGERRVNPADIALPQGYRVEAVAQGLTFPTAVTLDDQGRVYVLEAGYCYGEVWTTPRLLRIDNGRPTEVARGDPKHAPWNDVIFHDGAFYISEGGVLSGGRILRISGDGKADVLVDGLPSLGDHHTNGLGIHDGYLYFGQGTATNSGVVGIDNYKFGWLERHPDFHDIPGRDIRLAGQNFKTKNPLKAKGGETVMTGAFVPFGVATSQGQTIQGRLPCNGAIMRVRLGSDAERADRGLVPQLELVAWGLRNPYGLAFGAEGKLFVTENSFDVRGSRPVWGTGDLLWGIDTRQVLWHGWPDYHGDLPLTKSDHFTAPGKPSPQFLLAEHPNPPPKPVAKLGVHSSSNGIDFSRNERFGHAGEAFIAQFGDMAPTVGKVMAPVGFKVVRVNTETGVINSFAANQGQKNGPASRLKSGGLERPTDVRFSPDGTALYVADFGVVTMSEKGPHPHKQTGVVWRITREEER